MKESETIEFKSSWSDHYLKTISAFANTHGGTMVLGVNDQGDAIGIKNSKKLLELIPNKINQKLGIASFVDLKKKNKKEILFIKTLSSSVPISYDGKYYVRSGSTTQQLTGSELTQFLLKKTGKTWDGMVCHAGLSDIDFSTVETFKNFAKNRIPSISKWDSLEKILFNLELISRNQNLTHAAILLFGKRPQRFFISAKTRVGRFKTSIDITDTVIIEGNLFHQVDSIIEAIKKHLNVRFKIANLQREDIWEVPIEAIREAVTNAIIHRSYSLSAEIQIKIYDDHIWIWNPGKLLQALTVDQLKEQHASYPRNPLIANTFYLAGFIERWGSGTNRMIDLCKTAELPEPVYQEEQNGFSVCFYKNPYTQELLEKMGLNDRQQKALRYVQKKGKITNKQYQSICAVSERTASRDLSELVSKKIFHQTAVTGKGTKYTLSRQSRHEAATKPPKPPQSRHKAAKGE